MEKVLYVVWRADGVAADALRDELVGPVAGALTGRGARGVQVNVADSVVEGALVRIASHEPLPAAVVGVWVDSSVDPCRKPFDEVMAGVAPRWGALLVTESEPLPNTAHPPVPGQRTVGYAQVALLRRPHALPRDEWLQRWLGVQTRVAVETQATFRYVQHLVVRTLVPLPGVPPVDAVVEELFPMEALGDLHAFFGSGGDDAELIRRMEAMAASTSTFIDDAALDVLPTSEHVVSPLLDAPDRRSVPARGHRDPPA